MVRKKAPCRGISLCEIVRKCLPALQSVSLSLDTYGTSNDAETLRNVIDQLRGAYQTPPEVPKSPMDFVVSEIFKVTRQQVANALWHAFTGGLSWFKVTGTVRPERGRSNPMDQTSPGIVDYLLNQGGALQMATTDRTAQNLELSLDHIPRGLEALASYYPRHFADLINDNADHITFDALLQCCLFGEIIYG